MIQCRRMWIIWRERQIHESANGTDHESDRNLKLDPFAVKIVCPFNKRVIRLCVSPQLKAFIVEPGVGSQKGVLVKDKKWLGKVYQSIRINLISSRRCDLYFYIYHSVNVGQLVIMLMRWCQKVQSVGPFCLLQFECIERPVEESLCALNDNHGRGTLRSWHILCTFLTF